MSCLLAAGILEIFYEWKEWMMNHHIFWYLCKLWIVKMLTSIVHSSNLFILQHQRWNWIWAWVCGHSNQTGDLKTLPDVTTSLHYKIKHFMKNLFCRTLNSLWTIILRSKKFCKRGSFKVEKEILLMLKLRLTNGKSNCRKNNFF